MSQSYDAIRSIQPITVFNENVLSLTRARVAGLTPVIVWGRGEGPNDHT